MQTLTKVRRKILLLQAFVVATLVLMVFFAMGLSFFFLNLSESYGNQGFFVASLLPLLYCAVSFYIFFSYTAPKPKGITINKASAPDLIEYIENVIGHCGGNAKFGSIILTTGSSIYVYNEPSLANFLRPKPPTLVIGDSLMRFLSKEEFGAVLAHEIAHLEQPQTYYKAYLAKISNQSAKLAASGNSGFPRASLCRFMAGQQKFWRSCLPQYINRSSTPTRKNILIWKGRWKLKPTPYLPINTEQGIF